MLQVSTAICLTLGFQEMDVNKLKLGYNTSRGVEPGCVWQMLQVICETWTDNMLTNCSDRMILHTRRWINFIKPMYRLWVNYIVSQTLFTPHRFAGITGPVITLHDAHIRPNWSQAIRIVKFNVFWKWWNVRDGRILSWLSVPANLQLFFLLLQANELASIRGV